MIGNDERGYAEAIAWVAEHAPGPRVVVGLEGTRSYGIGLARVLQASGLTVAEIERPRRGERRRGKSDLAKEDEAGQSQAIQERIWIKTTYSPTIRAVPQSGFPSIVRTSSGDSEVIVGYAGEGFG